MNSISTSGSCILPALLRVVMALRVAMALLVTVVAKVVAKVIVTNDAQIVFRKGS